MGEQFPGTPLVERPPEGRLDSWKEIAAYLNRDVTTVQRWEKREGMPVHRHVHDKRGSVYALGSELDAWVQSRRIHLEEDQKQEQREEEETKESLAQTPADAEGQHSGRVAPRSRRWLAVAAAALVGLFAIAYVVHRG